MTCLFALCLGVVQGIVTGIRGLCNGLGPALYGVIFYIFHVNITDEDSNNMAHAHSTHPPLTIPSNSSLATNHVIFVCLFVC